MSLVYELVIGLLLACASALVTSTVVARKRNQRLPPGPPGEPILGNARQIPQESSWLYYAKLKEKYGQSS